MALAQRQAYLSLTRLLFGSPASAARSAQSPSFRPWLSSISFSLPAVSLNVPGLMSDLWEGILRAVPKKKTSHSKRRSRLLAGKALKDVRAINTCPGCGRPKKAHTLCPFCVSEIRESWKQATKDAQYGTK